PPIRGFRRVHRRGPNSLTRYRHRLRQRLRRRSAHRHRLADALHTRVAEKIRGPDSEALSHADAVRESVRPAARCRNVVEYEAEAFLLPAMSAMHRTAPGSSRWTCE